MNNSNNTYAMSEEQKCAIESNPGLNEAAINHVFPREIFEDADTPPAAPEPPAALPPQQAPAAPLAPLVPLGFSKDKCSRLVYYCRAQGKVVVLSPKDFNITYLGTLATPQAYAAWLGLAGAAPKWVEDNAEQIIRDAGRELIRRSLSMKGCFYDEAGCERPCGIWPDTVEPGALLYYTGKECYLARPGQLPVGVDCVRGGYVYSGASGVQLPAPVENPLTDEEGSLLFCFLGYRLWNLPACTYVLTGWLGCALLAAVLPVRPQLWLNAPAGLGKTFLKDDLAQILGPFAITCESAGSTAAGISQRLANSCFPVLFDEAECRADQRSVRKLEGVLELVRTAATGQSSCVLKGSADGTQRSYNVRSCFMLFSIANILSREADRSRFVQLALSEPANQQKDIRHVWARQEEGRRLISSPNFTARFVTRLLMRYGDIEANRRALIPFLRDMGASARRAEIYAALLAVCWSICHSKREIEAPFLEFFARCYKSLEKIQPCDNDQESCLDSLLTYTLPWEGGRINVATLCSLADTLPYGEELDRVTRTLAALGLRWQREERRLQADLYSHAFKSIYRDTDWPSGQVGPVLTAGCHGSSPNALGIYKTRARLGVGNPRSVLCIPSELVLCSTFDCVEK